MCSNHVNLPQLHYQRSITGSLIVFTLHLGIILLCLALFLVISLVYVTAHNSFNLFLRFLYKLNSFLDLLDFTMIDLDEENKILCLYVDYIQDTMVFIGAFVSVAIPF